MPFAAAQLMCHLRCFETPSPEIEHKATLPTCRAACPGDSCNTAKRTRALAIMHRPAGPHDLYRAFVAWASGWDAHRLLPCRVVDLQAGRQAAFQVRGER